MNEPNKAWWFVRSGIRFPFDDPKPEHIRLDDIVHHLSLINRWCGGTSKRFSVLEHVLYCDELARTLWGNEGKGLIFYNYEFLLYVLLHDAHEAYTNDVPTDLKTAIPALQEFQDRIDYTIHRAFGLSPPSPEYVEKISLIDELAKLGEAKKFMSPLIERVLRIKANMARPTLSPRRYGIRRARRIFRKRFDRYYRKMKDG